MFTLACLLAAAHASDGPVVTTRVATTVGTVTPAIGLALAEPPDPDTDPPEPDRADPPDPDFTNDGRVARLALAGRAGTFTATLALTEDVVGIEQITVPGARAPIVVWGDGAAASFYPPDPCVVFRATLADGSALDVQVTLDSPDGRISALAGRAVRAPDGFGAALQLDVTAGGAAGVTVGMSVAAASAGVALPLE